MHASSRVTSRPTTSEHGNQVSLAGGGFSSIVAIGEILWDVYQDGRRLGGAPLNFSAHARALGHPVCLVSALGADDLGTEAKAQIEALRLDSRYLQVSSQLATGTAGVSLDTDGSPQFEIFRPAAYDDIDLTEETLAQLRQHEAGWLYFGSLLAATPRGKECLERLLHAMDGATKFLDLNLRPGSDHPNLISKLLAHADVIKLNEAELERVQSLTGLPQSHEAFCTAACERFGWRAVAVTLGSHGCAMHVDGDYAEVPGQPITVVDSVGAGDAFSAAMVHGLSQRWSAARTAEFANCLAAGVAGKAGALPSASRDDDLP